MTEVWFKLVQFLTAQLGVPGSLLLGLLCYVVWLLNEERKAHGLTRDKVDAINEKRIELHATYMLAFNQLKDSITAIHAILGKSNAVSFTSGQAARSGSVDN